MLPDQPTATVVDNPGPPPPKRQRKGDPVYSGGLASLDRKISPPALGTRSSNAHSISTIVAEGGAFAEIDSSGGHGTKGGRENNRLINPCDFIDLTGEDSDNSGVTPSQANPNPKQKQPESRLSSPSENSIKALPSPIQLTSIRDLPASENVDTVGIKDILGDVMIKEAWIFNYLVDLDWVM